MHTEREREREKKGDSVKLSEKKIIVQKADWTT